MQLRETIDAFLIVFGEHTDWLTVVHNHDGAMGSLVDQRHGITDRRIRTQGDRCFEDGVTFLDVGHDAACDIDGNVLRQDRYSTTSGDRFGHAPSCYGGHVGDDEGNRCSDAVRSRQVDIHS